MIEIINLCLLAGRQYPPIAIFSVSSFPRRLGPVEIRRLIPAFAGTTIHKRLPNFRWIAWGLHRSAGPLLAYAFLVKALSDSS